MASKRDPIVLYTGPDCSCCEKKCVRVKVEDREALVCPDCDLSAIPYLPPPEEKPPPG